MHLLNEYLALRRAAGFKLKGAEYRLRHFVHFAEERGDTHVCVDTAVAWARTAKSPHNRHVRLKELAIFARHLRAEDPRHEVPSPQIFAFKRHARLPYIYSDDDIRRLLDAAGRLQHRPGDSMGDTYRTLLGLLAVTGLRLGEAVNLCLRDFGEHGLLIRETKFRKSRLIPLHHTTVDVLAVYCNRWRVVAEPDDAFFVSTIGTRLNKSRVDKLFRRLTDQLGLTQAPKEGRLPGPRIHDLRHTVAVRALESCPEDRSEINKHMLALSTYLGHVSVASTYWYLHATPLLMTDIADACEAWLVRGAR